MADDLKYKIELEADTSGAERTATAVGRVNSALRGLAAWGGGVALARQLSALAGIGVRWQSSMEEARRGLAGVLGSASAAGARLQELNEIEGLSGYDVSELANVSRQLQIMTGGALAAGSGLRLVTDVSRGTSTPLEAVADALGRVYGQIQSGSPELGRGMQQLVMMGAISASTALRVQSLSKSGGDAWGALSAELQRFGGAGTAALDTLQGRLRALKNTVEQALGAGMKPIFSGLRDELGKLNSTFENDGLTPALRRIGRQAADTVGPLAKMVAQLATNPAALTTAATALMAYVQILAVRGVAALAGFGAGLVRNTAAHLVNDAAMRREAAAAAQLSVHIRGGMQAFEQARARVAMLQQTFSGKSFGALSTTFARRSQADVAAIVGLMETTGKKAGTAFSRSLAGAMRMPSASQIGGAAMLGLSLGTMLKSMIEGKTAEGNTQLDAAKELQETFDDQNAALQERIDKLSTAAEKAELLKSIETELTTLQRQQSKSRYGELEKGAMEGQLSALRILREKARQSDAELRESKAKSQAASERIWNAGAALSYTGDPLRRRAGEDEAAWLERKLKAARDEEAAARKEILTLHEKANSGNATGMEGERAAAAAQALEKAVDAIGELELDLAEARKSKEDQLHDSPKVKAVDPVSESLAPKAPAGYATILSDRLSRIGGFVGGAAQDMSRRAAFAAERSAKLLATIERNTRSAGSTPVYA